MFVHQLVRGAARVRVLGLVRQHRPARAVRGGAARAAAGPPRVHCGRRSGATPPWPSSSRSPARCSPAASPTSPSRCCASTPRCPAGSSASWSRPSWAPRSGTWCCVTAPSSPPAAAPSSAAPSACCAGLLAVAVGYLDAVTPPPTGRVRAARAAGAGGAGAARADRADRPAAVPGDPELNDRSARDVGRRGGARDRPRRWPTGRWSGRCNAARRPTSPTPLGAPARVSVHGRPFLTQALRGRYRDVEVRAPDLAIGVARRADPARAPGQRAPAAARPDRAPGAGSCRSSTCTATCSCPTPNWPGSSPVPGLRFSYRDDTVIATARLPVPGLGQLAGVTGEAVATHRRGRRRAGAGAQPRRRRASASPAWWSTSCARARLRRPAAAAAVRAAHRRSSRPTATGLRVAGSAQAVVFRAVAPAAPTT